MNLPQWGKLSPKQTQGLFSRLKHGVYFFAIGSFGVVVDVPKNKVKANPPGAVPVEEIFRHADKSGVAS